MRGRPRGSRNHYPSDTQRERLYKAEREIASFHNIEFESIKAIERFVRRFMKRKAWTKRTHIHQVRVSSNNRRFATGAAYGYTAELDFPKWAWTKMIIAHELAHCLTPPTSTRAAHGREYAGTYIYLVGKICGSEARTELIKQFHKYDIDWDSNYAN